jgi:hypothetical protein
MSEERRKRQSEREQTEGENQGLLGKVILALVVVAVFAATYTFARYKRNSKVDGFARCISASGAKMYGAYWCPHCLEEKELFGSSFQYVNYLECGVKGDPKGQTEVCKQAGIKHYPTWEFRDGSRMEGKQEFPTLSNKSGCPVP